jgi:DNA modification methylase
MGLGTVPLETPKPTSGFRDSAFARNRELPLHRWVPWIAGFSAQFVDDALAKYTSEEKRKGAWVLDPFAGVGTTLVQGYLHGFNVMGFEINPYAAMASCMKLESAKMSLNGFERHIAAYERFMDAKCPDYGACRWEPHSVPPDGFRGRTQLFSPKVEKRILATLDFIKKVAEPSVANLFRLALGSVMVSVSNYSYEPSLTRRAAVAKPDIEDAPVAATVSSKLRLMLEDIEWLQARMMAIGHVPQGRVIQESFLSARGMPRRKGFADLVVTSPPYLNNYHYPRNTRPQLHWLGFASGPGYSGARENESFGKFWQTVRDLPPISLSFRFRALESLIQEIRGVNTDKGGYGGPGWANYAATYFEDTYRFCGILASVLRPKGVAVVVLGNSVIQGVEVKTDQFFGKIAELCGLSFEDTILIRKKRTGNSIIQSSVRTDKAAHRVALYESAIILRKAEGTM